MIDADVPVFEIGKLDLAAGDILVVKLSRDFTRSDRATIFRTLRDVLDDAGHVGVPILITAPGIDLEALRRASPGALADHPSPAA